MAPDAAVTVESSPTDVLKTLTPAQHKTWRATGEIPEVKETPKETPKESKQSTEVAESSPAAKEVAAPAAEKTVAEVPAKPAAAAKEPKAKPVGAEARILDLIADNKKLAQELETLRKVPVAAPTKDEKAPVKPSRADVDSKTGQAKYATDDEFLDARDKYVADMASRQTRQDIAKETNDRAVAEQNRITQQRMVNAVKIATERHPDFTEVLKIETKDGKTAFNAPAIKLIKTNGIIDAWCVDSEAGMEILYHLATRPEEVERIQALNSFAAARELTKLEDKLSAPASAAAPAPEVKKVPESSTTPKVSSAPAPAASVSGKATAPVDEEEAAVKSEDFKRFQKAANAEEFAKRTGK
jgi:hypothetical protein